ncbi:HlyC/CorC family transporter [Sedimentimonas flavescens]|uniref:HlyC/CorC family transporter n=1 Tax=Sedimentimonas flavescens TaxID=2851012 RepID=A0ABT2ZX54_9RHOB|nr:HlyC/CorC family transporter [Sedimentimonas flavescens]MBW0157097.1 HlyC/CorC family transporter [Sedimentimonas flavescens]MCT2538366.1 HlyC/CorC family transporter [Sedimentimonas flavescens]MCV2878333.1 HlyC/CorC family transporter [Sedimentimonas flavescens]WBL34589.1 HlyC/CorC family transporter [Sinirhodobacter sp. HNIBRBA609]
MQTPILDTAFWLTAAAIIGLLLMSGFFSGSETALTAASRAKLRNRADKGEKGAEAALNVTEDSERLIGAILLGNNVVNILSASLATALFTRLFGDSGVALATLVMTTLVLIFSEVLPKTYAISNPETVASRVARPIRFLIVLLAPIVTIVRTIVRGILFLFGYRTDADQHMFSIHEEIAGALAIGTSEGTVDKEDRDRLLGALDLGNRTVEEIMRHRSQIEMIDAEADPSELLAQVLASPHTRLPLYKGERENVVGVIHAKDLLRAVERFLRTGDGKLDSVSDLDVMKVAMKPYFVPETTPLDEQMREFLKRRTHFALVVDEYGDLKGLLTLEDILEEIVGEITDEFDPKAERQLKPTESGDYIVDGAMTIRDLNRETDWSLPDDEANTVAGLVIHEAQTIPDAGQVFSFHGFRFEVIERKDNRITKIKIRPLLALLG